MKRQRIAALIIIVMIAAGSLYLLYPSLFPAEEEQEDEGGKTTNVNYSSLNNLNWWDIAWNSIDLFDMLTPLSRISSYPDRYGLSPDYYEAGDYLIERLEGFGLTASYFGNRESVVAYQPGYGNDSRAIVFGANLDTRESIGPQINSNSIGCAVVTAIASGLSQFRLPVDIYYCFYSASWVLLDALTGLRAMWGSIEIVDYFEEQNINVIANYDFSDLLLYDPNQDQEDRILIDYAIDDSLGYQQTKYLGDLLVSFMKKSGIDIASAVYDELTQSDHWKYWAAGIPAVHVHQGHIAQPGSPPEDSLSSTNYNFTQALLVAKGAATVAVYLALRGNGEITREKLYVSLEPEENATIYPVMTRSQHISLNGTISNNQSVVLRLTKAGSYLIPLTTIDETNFSLTSQNFTGTGELTLYVRNIGNETSKLELNLYYLSDTDGNGIVDALQYSWPDPVPPLDWDGDGLSDIDEVKYHTDIFLTDTDKDGMNDYVEIANGLNPLQRDAREDLDGDGLSNQHEIRIGTYPNSSDSDNDLMPDEWEVTFRTNPTLNDSQVDRDNDNLTNLQEYLYGSDPRSADGDYDGVSDYVEYQLGMNALNDDTDSDGLGDFLELKEGLNPLVPDYDLDLEPDGSDHNPKVNFILVLILLTFVPVGLGTVFFWKRLQ